jgi:hypothetical protein
MYYIITQTADYTQNYPISTWMCLAREIIVAPVETDCTVIRFLCVSSKFGTCTVISVYGTLVEDKMRRFKGECAHFIFSKCNIYVHSRRCKCQF